MFSKKRRAVKSAWATDSFVCLRLFGVPQHDAAFTGRCKRLAGTFRNHPSFLLGQRGVNVQHEWIRVLPSSATMKGTR